MTDAPSSENRAPLELTWESGGTAALLDTDAEHVTFLSTVAAPPGRPLRGTTEHGDRYQVKVRGCKRVQESPARFQIDGRFFNLSKAQRAQLQAVKTDQPG